MKATRTPAPAPAPIPEATYTITMAQSEAMLLSEMFLLNVSIPEVVAKRYGTVQADKVRNLMSDVRTAISVAQRAA